MVEAAWPYDAAYKTMDVVVEAALPYDAAYKTMVVKAAWLYAAPYQTMDVVVEAACSTMQLIRRLRWWWRLLALRCSL